MEYPIHTLFSRTAKAQQNYLRPYLNALGLSPGQPKILRGLTAHGPCSQRELADICDVDPSAVCRLLDGMERGGFLTRSPSQTDRRAGLVALTDKGRAIAEAIYERHTLISRWLIHLGVDPKVAAEDACRMEHVISAETFEALKKHAGVLISGEE